MTLAPVNKIREQDEVEKDEEQITITGLQTHRESQPVKHCSWHNTTPTTKAGVKSDEEQVMITVAHTVARSDARCSWHDTYDDQ